MAESLIVNSGASETRVALLENDVPVELHVERHKDRGLVGNIYTGRVVRVLPGMQAAFVEFGGERTGFLYVNDVVPRSHEGVAPPGDGGADELDVTAQSRRSRAVPAAKIADVLKVGQDLIVQVQKEPVGTKGARLTCHITLPGRNLVYTPYAHHVGVSLRIGDAEERERLRGALLAVCAEDDGFIVRTAAEGEPESLLQREAERLRQVWQALRQEAGSRGAPHLLLADLDLALRMVRDYFGDDTEHIWVDQERDFTRISAFIGSFAPGEESRVRLYREALPIFDRFNVEVELERALERRVWLKSGGYIVFDETEALTVVDVNSGRFVGTTNLEETITQINLEAVREVAHQIRLRNLGGIIIIDFIDMADSENRQKVLTALEEALKRDKVRNTVVRMSEIGLVEMTRKRVRESLSQVLRQACPYCKGTGEVKNESTVANDILRNIARRLARETVPTVLVNLHPSIADYLYEVQADEIDRIEKNHQTQVIPVARDGYHREQYEIVTSGESGTTSTSSRRDRS